MANMVFASNLRVRWLGVVATFVPTIDLESARKAEAHRHPVDRNHCTRDVRGVPGSRNGAATLRDLPDGSKLKRSPQTARMDLNHETTILPPHFARCRMFDCHHE